MQKKISRCLLSGDVEKKITDMDNIYSYNYSIIFEVHLIR